MLDLITAISTAIASLLSGVSIFILVKARITQKKLEKMNLTITPRKRLANSKDEIFYLYLSFSNQSALPISILNLNIKAFGENSTWHNADEDEDGTLFVDAINVIETERVNKTVTRNHQNLSKTLPFVICPYGVFNGYFAFHASKQSSFTICHKEIVLTVTTTRKSYRLQMDLNPTTFYETSYRHDGLMFGPHIYGKIYQDTSIPNNRI